MIILEGMDNSGKTTLANELVIKLKDHKIYKLSEVDKPTPLQLDRMAIDIKTPKFSKRKLILDRFSFISELVYGEVLRDNSHYGTVNNWRILLEHIRYNPFYLIYCRPPNEVILNNLDFCDQMKGVKTNSIKLLKRYDEVMGILGYVINQSPNPGIIVIYDFTNPENQIDTFLELYRYQENT